MKEEDGRKFIIGVHIGNPIMKKKNGEELKRNVAVKLTTQKRTIINQWVAEIAGELWLSKFVSI